MLHNVASTRPIEGVIFDLDGVLIDSESTWSAARGALTKELGGRWSDRAQTDMMGMSSTEWSCYMHDELAVPLPAGRISEQVVERLTQLFRRHLPLVPSARSVVTELAKRWPLAIASSSNRPLIDLSLELSGLSDSFRASVSSEEVARGKPAPDVYLAAAGRLGMDARACMAIEDSSGGLRAASAAGMRVVAIPNRDFPPGRDAVSLAHTVLWSLGQLTPAVVEALDSAPTEPPSRGEAAAPQTWDTGGFSHMLDGLNFGPLPGPGDSDG
jgi:HAD superfamily hydrolase (TIGR01509 family)